MSIEDGCIGVDLEALRLGCLDGGNGAVIHTGLADRLVMVILQPVQMDGEEQVRRWLEQVQLLFQKQRIGAQRHILLARHEAFDDLTDFLVDQRLATGDCHDRSAALVDSVETLLRGQALVEDRLGIVDLAAAGTGEVALEQRLEHQHQRVTLVALELLLHHVGANAHLLHEGNSHDLSTLSWLLSDRRDPRRAEFVDLICRRWPKRQ
jgi:hypothetical protein